MMLEIRGIWLCHMSRWDRYVLRPQIWMETSRSGIVPHIGPYICAHNPVNCPAVICLPRMAILLSFGREMSLVNIIGPRSIFPILFSPAINLLLYFSVAILSLLSRAFYPL